MSVNYETTYLKKLSLFGGQVIELAPNSIVVLVGANNSGKSFFLKCLESQLWGFEVNEVSPRAGVIESVEIGWQKREVFEYLLEVAEVQFELSQNGTGSYIVPFSPGGRSSHFSRSQIEKVAQRTSHFDLFAQVFFELDDALDRILETDPKTQSDVGSGRSPNIVKALEDRSAAQKTIEYFRAVFHQPLSFYDHRGVAGFLLADTLPSAARAGEARDQETIKHMESSLKLWNQGLGMRSVAGLLLRIFGAERPIMAIDEPEAFLHPPQAGALGAALAEIAGRECRQLFVATHELNLLNGLLENVSSPVTIIQMENNKGVYRARQIEPNTLNEAKSKSIVRYSTILNSLFVRFTVLTENEKDAYFYSSAMSHYFSGEHSVGANVSLHDFHFLNVSGKNNLDRTLSILSELGAESLVIADLDVIESASHVDSLLNAIGVLPEQRRQVAERISDLFEGLRKTGRCNQDSSIQSGSKSKIFERFHEHVSENPGLNPILDRLIAALDEHRIFLLPWGELEDFDRRFGKKSWIEGALNAQVHEGDLAQSLVTRIMKQVL